MQRIDLSDIGWILFGLVIYLVASSSLPGVAFRWIGAQIRRREVRPITRRSYRKPAREPLPISTRRLMSRRYARTDMPIPLNPNPPVRAEIPLLNGVEPRSEPFVNRPELTLNAEELAAVARMIDHNRTAAKPSKSSTIAAGFGISRGGSEAYKRASAIYDALFGAPAPAVTYRELSPEQERFRAQLLKQKGALNS